MVKVIGQGIPNHPKGTAAVTGERVVEPKVMELAIVDHLAKVTAAVTDDQASTNLRDKAQATPDPPNPAKGTPKATTQDQHNLRGMEMAEPMHELHNLEKGIAQATGQITKGNQKDMDSQFTEEITAAVKDITDTMDKPPLVR